MVFFEEIWEYEKKPHLWIVVTYVFMVAMVSWYSPTLYCSLLRVCFSVLQSIEVKNYISQTLLKLEFWKPVRFFQLEAFYESWKTARQEPFDCCFICFCWEPGHRDSFFFVFFFFSCSHIAASSHLLCGYGEAVAEVAPVPSKNPDFSSTNSYYA